MNNQRKTFSDLEFEKHNVVENAVQARLDLGNGFEISVVSMKEGERPFGGLYGNASAGTYEVAVFHNGNMTPLAKYDDVVGWQDEVAITRLMKEVQTNSTAWLKLLQEIRDEYNAELLED
jgi:peptide methionine sulfoxide reductase MsrB